jgi:hypothetical protein
MNLLLAKIGGGVALIVMAYAAGYTSRAVKAGLEDAVRAGQAKEAEDNAEVEKYRREQEVREYNEATARVLEWGVSERDRLAARVKRLQQQQAADAGGGVPIVPGAAGSLEACQQRLDDISREASLTNEAVEGSNREAALCAADVVTLHICQDALTRRGQSR